MKKDIVKNFQLILTRAKDRDIGIQKNNENLQLVSVEFKELQKDVINFHDRNYSIEMKHIDVLITISQSLLSFSIALFVAFLSISRLEGNVWPPLIAVISSSAILGFLIFYRKKRGKKLNLPYEEAFATAFKNNIGQINKKLTESEKILSTFSKGIENDSKEVARILNELKRKK